MCPRLLVRRNCRRTRQAQIFIPLFAYSFQAQSAYSFANHVGTIANYSYFRTTTKGEGQLGELGIGYYTNPKKAYFGVFLGYGISTAKDDTYHFSFFGNPNSPVSRYNANRVMSNYTSWFLMPSYAFRFNRLTLVTSLKTSRIDFENTYYGTDFVLLEKNTASYHFEPAITLKVGLGQGPISFIGQTGMHLTNDNEIQLLNNFGRISVGFQWRLSPKEK
jgi:hypothetical protein